jgi:DMSO/TMAO reductase YedYZ molybdopterin-dependent catalytic subunit
VDPDSFRLEVAGAVESSLSLSLDALRTRERTSEPITFECAGNGRALLEPRPVSQPWLTEAVGTAEWGGTRLAGLLDEAGPAAGAVELLFTALDSGVEGGVRQTYERALPIAEAEHALLAYEMNGMPLPPQHGYPLRLVVPGWYGMQNVKWLTRITVLEEPYAGFQNAVAYRMYGEDGEPGEPVTRMLPRSLTVPPGVPDFMTRTRHVEPGPVTLRGRAWSGQARIETVEVSTDGGKSFAAASLDEPLGPNAWRGWRFDWEATPGEHVISSRATDAAGNTQPLEPPWNLKGYANNAVERIMVVVAAPS